jgi:hypothetical protein
LDGVTVALRVFTVNQTVAVVVDTVIAGLLRRFTTRVGCIGQAVAVVVDAVTAAGIIEWSLGCRSAWDTGVDLAAVLANLVSGAGTGSYPAASRRAYKAVALRVGAVGQTAAIVIDAVIAGFLRCSTVRISRIVEPVAIIVQAHKVP